MLCWYSSIWGQLERSIEIWIDSIDSWSAAIVKYPVKTHLRCQLNNWASSLLCLHDCVNIGGVNLHFFLLWQTGHLPDLLIQWGCVAPCTLCCSYTYSRDLSLLGHFCQSDTPMYHEICWYYSISRYICGSEPISILLEQQKLGLRRKMSFLGKNFQKTSKMSLFSQFYDSKHLYITKFQEIYIKFMIFSHKMWQKEHFLTIFLKGSARGPLFQGAKTSNFGDQYFQFRSIPISENWYSS